MTKTKYLLATALLALCMILAAGMASAQTGWLVSDQDLPSDLAWDDSYDASVNATHSGSGQLAPGTYGLVSVQGATSTASAIDRWGRVTSDAGLFPFMGGGTYLLDFTITGPALTTLWYTPPVGPTAPGVPLSVDCNWILATPLAPTPVFMLDDTAVQDTVVSRFPDVGQAVVGWYHIEQLAGRVPLVVTGYPNGTYGPTLTVSRQQMAIFMGRALNLPLLPYVGVFPDVASDLVGADYIEALVTAGIAGGFGDGTYRPTDTVTREQMAIYVARGMAGGDANVPSGPAVANFPDVATSALSYKYVEYCFANEVAGGYPNGTYGPTVNVTRQQMAIFVWRGFMVSTGVPVVIGGPACTSVDPRYNPIGWSSDHVDPSYAYVAFDALRLDTNLCAGVNNAWDVQFEVRTAANPTGAAVASSPLFSHDAAMITTILNTARASGNPYWWITPMLAGPQSLVLPILAPGDYVLVLLVEDETGTMHEVGWKRAASTYVGRFFPFTVS